MEEAETRQGLVRFGVSVPVTLVRAFDERIAQLGYTNRSEAIRDLMRAHLVEAEWEQAHGQVVGTVTIIYDHEKPDLSQVLTSLQHRYVHAIVCTTHVHLDAHNCMEVIVLRGRAEEIQKIASSLISARGVKHGKLVCSTTGAELA